MIRRFITWLIRPSVVAVIERRVRQAQMLRWADKKFLERLGDAPPPSDVWIPVGERFADLELRMGQLEKSLMCPNDRCPPPAQDTWAAPLSVSLQEVDRILQEGGSRDGRA